MSATDRFREAASIGEQLQADLEAYGELVHGLIDDYAPSDRERKQLLCDLAHHATGARCSTRLVSVVAARTDGQSNLRILERAS